MMDDKMKKGYGLIEEEDDRKPNTLGYTSLILLIMGFNSTGMLFKLILFVLSLFLGIVSLGSKVRQKAISIAAVALSLIFIIGPARNIAAFVKTAVSDRGCIEGAMEETLQDEAYGAAAENAEAGSYEFDNTAGETVTAEATETVPETEAIPLEELVTIESYATPRDLVVIANNTSDEFIYIMLDVIFYDAEGKMLSMQESSFGQCAPGQKLAGYVLSPRDTEGNFVPFDHYEIRKDIEERELREGYEYYGDQFIIESNISVDGSVLADISNPTGLYFNSLTLRCIFYNADEAVGISIETSSGFGEEDVFKFYPPYDADFQQLSFDRYEIYINSTIRYI